MGKSDYLLQKLGDPTKKESYKHMSLHVMPVDIVEKIPCMPKKIYCNKKFFGYLINSLRLVIFRGLEMQIKTYDGCYNVRPIRGHEDKNTYSTHSWGVAIDINKKENPLGKKPLISEELVACFDLWFDWGGRFKRQDGMHFELKKDLI